MKKDKADPETMNKLKLVLYIKLFQGVFGHVDKNYNLAFQSFRWCLQFIAYSKRTRLFASIADEQIGDFMNFANYLYPCCVATVF